VRGAVWGSPYSKRFVTGTTKIRNWYKLCTSYKSGQLVPVTNLVHNLYQLQIFVTDTNCRQSAPGTVPGTLCQYYHNTRMYLEFRKACRLCVLVQSAWYKLGTGQTVPVEGKDVSG
jgi:hypothetical protein